MNILVTISRILVGSLFIISGLIKANDTLGFSYKLQEYFAKDVLNLEFFIPYALPIAALVCIVEIVLGFATLLGGKMKLTAWSLLLMIVFFTFLTFYSAYFNKVTSCGCFGDALKLTPWTSFYKDLVLLVFILVIFIRREKIGLNTLAEDRVILPISVVLIALASVLVFKWNFPWIFTVVVLAIAMLIKTLMKSSNASQWAMAGWVTLATSFFCYYTYAHLPIRDFRPYAVGKNIIEGMKTAEELNLTPPQYAYNYTLKNSRTGEEKVMSSNEYMDTKIWQDTTWQITETSDPFQVKEGYEPPIHDFAPVDENGEDRTLSVLDNPDYYFFVVAYNITKSAGEPQKRITALYNDATADGKKVHGLTSSTREEVQQFKFEHQSPVEYLTNDEITLKTMVRSNPGIMLLKKGTVIAMWHYNDLPSYSEIKSKYMK
jgi:uncharacterized membrane protein YphA (DoxX/SURF4 family)